MAISGHAGYYDEYGRYCYLHKGRTLGEIMSEKKEDLVYFKEYVKVKEQVNYMEAAGEGDTKRYHQLNNQLNVYWNKLSAKQQREIADKYIFSFESSKNVS